jgi:hypothetical protein
MATTTNYGFEIPDDTDLVKDGALAMRDLGQDVDTQLFTALGGDYPGLRLVKKQTVGTAVASVTVTGAFSATYDNYKIIYSDGVANTGAALALTLGSTATGYAYSLPYGLYSGAQGNLSATNATSWLYAGNGITDIATFSCELLGPFKTRHTRLTNCSYVDADLSGSFGGVLKNTTSYTAFTITGSGGATLTGGTIYVYGYGAS